MENLMFSLNVTGPVFLLMLLGMLFKRIGIIDDSFASKMNKFVFTIPLPVLVFEDLATTNFKESWSTGFVLFCLVVTVVSIFISYCLSLLLKDRSNRGEFIQASYRSSAALLGIAIITNIYGTSGMAPMMIIGSVPMYNIIAVLVLSLFSPQSDGLNKETIKRTLKGILKNPILIGIELGLVWSFLGIPLSGMAAKTVSSVAGIATPLGLMAMGATIDFKKAMGKAGASVLASFMKLIGFVGIFLPIAIAVGYRRQELVAILVMLGSATTVSSFVMARNMGHDGVLSSTVVMITTILSGFTLTMWLWLCRSLGVI